MSDAFSQTPFWLIAAFTGWIAANVCCILAIRRRRWVQPNQIDDRQAIYASKLNALRTGVYVFPLAFLAITNAVLQPKTLIAISMLFLFSLIIVAISVEWSRAGQSASVEWDNHVVSGPSWNGTFRRGPHTELRIDQLVYIARPSDGRIQLVDETDRKVAFSSSWEGYCHLLRDLFHSKPEIFKSHSGKRWLKEIIKGPPPH